MTSGDSHVAIPLCRLANEATKPSKLLLRTSYLCESGFSAEIATKTKLRSMLDISNTLQVSSSPITPRWDRLVEGKRAQGSPLTQRDGELYFHALWCGRPVLNGGQSMKYFHRKFSYMVGLNQWLVCLLSEKQLDFSQLVIHHDPQGFCLHCV